MTKSVQKKTGRKSGTRQASGKPTSATTPSKIDQLVALLQRADGATLPEMMATTGWQQHSVRGAMAGALRKRGHGIISEKSDGVRRYRIGPAA